MVNEALRALVLQPLEKFRACIWIQFLSVIAGIRFGVGHVGAFIVCIRGPDPFFPVRCGQRLVTNLDADYRDLVVRNRVDLGRLRLGFLPSVLVVGG